MRNRMYGGVRGRKTKVGRKLLRFPPTRFCRSGVNSQALTSFVSYSFPISSTSYLSLNSLTTTSAIIHQKNVPLLKFSHIKMDGGCRETVLHLSFSQMAYAF